MALQAWDLDGAWKAYGAALNVVDNNDELREHRGKALSGVADVLQELGRSERAAAMYRDALSLEVAPSRLRATILYDLAAALTCCRLYDEASLAIEEAREIFTRIGDDYNRAYLDFFAARVAVRKGDWAHARRLLDTATGYLLAIEDMESMREVQLVEAEYAIGRGQLERARQVLTETLKAAAADDCLRDVHRCKQLLASVPSDATSDAAQI